ncbi:unnamed protein product [Protopolystoma xenopodis]|uniref:Serine-threonine/tyrosine-protein kinase catalytic domain-containing protein n=1 Tax=Protopolystoma xenopodis TaxID=117903 RepID=A0A448XLP5_9PLAT|nr:unnamed protein product [Protopolystoma xenopodis]
MSHNLVDKWEISKSSIILRERIGQGQFGEVYRAIWNGTTPVAVKTLKATSTGFLFICGFELVSASPPFAWVDFAGRFVSIQHHQSSPADFDTLSYVKPYRRLGSRWSWFFGLRRHQRCVHASGGERPFDRFGRPLRTRGTSGRTGLFKATFEQETAQNGTNRIVQIRRQKKMMHVGPSRREKRRPMSQWNANRIR